jgi:cytochrome c2
MFRIAAIAIIGWLTSAAIIGCARELPEQDTYAGQLYIRRCSGCHAPYDPRTMTPAMWQVQVGAMEPKMRAAGLAPLTPDQRQTILDYLTRNAGSG